MGSKLEKQYKQCLKALDTLEEVLEKDSSKIIRDASIQRFEYSVEIFWKVLKTYLDEVEGITCVSPKKCIRSVLKSGYVTEESTEELLEMIDDRNLTVHTYIEEVAEKIYKKIPAYLKLMKKLMKKLGSDTKSAV